MKSIKYKLSAIPALAMLIITGLAACSKNEPDSYKVNEKQYLLFDAINKKGDPAILGDVFFTKEGNQTKIRMFYYQETQFRNQRPIALYANDAIAGGAKIMDLSPFTGEKASYAETTWNIPYEEAIKNTYHLKVFKAPSNDTAVAVADLGMSGFKGFEWNFDYPLFRNGANLEQGKILAWQRRNGDYYINVSIDTLMVGKQYVIDMYVGDTAVNGGQKWVAIGEIPNVEVGKKYKVININSTVSGQKLDRDILKNADAHIELRKMPDNVIVAKGRMGKYKP